jgi:hypothetical protein
VFHLWSLAAQHRVFSNEVKVKHVLWALLFLKTYGNEAQMSAMAQVDRKTFRKWIWIVVPGIAQLYEKVVSRLRQIKLCSTYATTNDIFRLSGTTDSAETETRRARSPLTALTFEFENLLHLALCGSPINLRAQG